jgi:hypothetical protein
MSIDFSMSDEHLSLIRQSETHIEHVFKQHLSTLLNQKWKIIDQISEWSTTLIRQIQEHVTTQRDLLEQVYEKKVSDLNTMRDRFLKHALVYEQKNETKKIKLLLKRCDTLKYDLATLGYLERPIASIQLVTEEQSMEQNQNECSEHKTEDEQSRNELPKDHVNNTEPIESSSPKPALINTEPIK